MPIKRENFHLYPGGSPHSKEWKAIVAQIKARAGNVCERCHAPNHVLIRRDKAVGVYLLPDGDLRDADTGERLGRLVENRLWNGKLEDPVKVVLTISHFDHDPTVVSETWSLSSTRRGRTHSG
jgi:hypothetical protein